MSDKEEDERDSPVPDNGDEGDPGNDPSEDVRPFPGRNLGDD